MHEGPSTGVSDQQHIIGGVRMQLKCIVWKRFVDELGIREWYECYTAKAVIDGTVNYTLGLCASRT